MFKLEYSHRYFRAYLKVVKNNPSLMEDYRIALNLLIEDPRHPKLRSHDIESLKCWSSSVTGDIRILWNYKEGDTITLIDTGSHSGNGSIY